MRIRLPEDKFFRHGLAVSGAAAFVGACNLAYHLFMIRTLTVAEYGALNVLAALFLAFVQPVDVLETVVTKFTAVFAAPFIAFAFRIAAVAGVGFLAVFTVFSAEIGGFFKAGPRSAILILALLLFFSCFLAIVNGVLKGSQRFRAFSVLLIAENLLKLGLGILLVSAGAGVAGAMGGWAAAQGAAVAIGALLILRVGAGKAPMTAGETAAICGFAAFAAAQNILVALAGNMDLFLVRRFFPPEQSGFYSIAQMAGKAMLVFPFTVSVVMFPKTSAAYAAGGRGEDIFWKSLFCTALVSAVLAAAVIAFPAEVVRLISGSRYPECIPLVRLFAAAMGFFSLCIVIFNYNLSIHRFRYLVLLAFSLLAETALIIIFHETLVQVLAILTAISVLLFAASLWISFPFPRRGFHL